MMSSFLDELKEQRWDDHRYYHHSRINQTLHLISALTFASAYVLAFWDLALAVIMGWVVAMTTRQIGHFFFEPKSYDEANRATHDHKEQIKVGYNLRRKVVLMAVWAVSPLILVLDPTLFGLFDAHQSHFEFGRHVAQLWLTIGVGAIVLRTLQLFFLKSVQSGLVWATKIVTDPFHDIWLYYKAPLHLMRGELIEKRGPA